MISGPRDTRSLISTPGSFGLSSRVRYLTVVFGPQRKVAQRVSLHSGHSLVIGREESPGASTLVLEDDQVSRVHARVEHVADGDRFELLDCGSRNGTFIDGARVTEKRDLVAGSVLRVGGTLIVFGDRIITAQAEGDNETPALRGQSLAMQRVR